MSVQAEVEMPKYKCHKEVHALKIKSLATPLPSGDCMFEPEEDGYGCILLRADYMRKHDPKEGGYYVVYADGYESFSPSNVFEAGYTQKE